MICHAWGTSNNGARIQIQAGRSGIETISNRDHIVNPAECRFRLKQSSWEALWEKTSNHISSQSAWINNMRSDSVESDQASCWIIEELSCNAIRCRASLRAKDCKPWKLQNAEYKTLLKLCTCATELLWQALNQQWIWCQLKCWTQYSYWAFKSCMHTSCSCFCTIIFKVSLKSKQEPNQAIQNDCLQLSLPQTAHKYRWYLAAKIWSGEKMFIELPHKAPL